MPTTFFLNEDIISEILTRLPAKELARLCCVCRQWLSLTSNPCFIQNHSAHNPHPSTSGFFLCDHNYGATYFPPKANLPGLPDPTLSFIPTRADGTLTSIETSCNGLIICRQAIQRTIHNPMYYVCNPTTRAFVKLPVPKEVGRNFSLAFDPSKSPHYKVVSIWTQIHIYSSETHLWKLFMDKKTLREFGGLHDSKSTYRTSRSVYFNNVLIWLGKVCLLLFDTEGEYMKKLPMPPELPQPSKVVYMGESGGKLQMIGKSENEQPAVFCILEMDSQCSGWSLLCKVDLASIKDLYHEIEKWPIWVSGTRRNIRRFTINHPGFSPVRRGRRRRRRRAVVVECARKGHLLPTYR